ncbi:MAG: lipase family protein [Bacteroidales bacterium]|nr:lipase family protein [Bacteroidales bacterium]
MQSSFKQKKYSFSLYSLLLILVVGLFVTPGCKKESTNDEPANETLVTYQKILTHPVSTIKQQIGVWESLYPEATSIVSHTTSAVDVYKITYNTVYKGEAVLASGLVCVPQSQDSCPIISFQNGTNTLKSGSPSEDPANYYYTLMEYMAGNGYIITFPDYIGFGASSQFLHPYYERETTDRAVIDMIRACHELLGENDIQVKFNGEHFLMGYSQGGWATLSGLKNIETNYKTTIPVTATSCGAGAYDMMAMSNYVMAQKVFPGPLYLPYFIYSQQLFGAHNDPLSKFFNEPYASRIPELFSGTYTNTQVDAQLNDTISVLLKSNMITDLGSGIDFAQLRSLLVKNSVTAWQPTSKINFYHGSADLNVPPEQSQLIYNSFLDLGVGQDKIQLISLPGTDHETSLLPWGLKTINWFNEIKK